ncbi:MAG TPA: type II toxin-antitoxin system VapC family toxin [Polyangiaceae bacterium]|nr:type II toxin-antitoxin system VapC family toxin [Polyangiaceae bacterium]
MSLLLDTHVLLWCLANPARIRREVSKRLVSPSEMVYVSTVSAWEIEVKRSLGKLEAPTDFEEQLEAHRFVALPVHLRHVRALGTLPRLHADPFDRMLVAQALADDLVVVTSDEQVRAYPVRTLEA